MEETSSYRCAIALPIIGMVLVCWPRHSLWGSRTVGPTRRSCAATGTIEDLRLDSSLLLLQSGSACLDQGTLDVTSDVGREHRPRIQRARYRLLPRFQHLIQFATSLRIDQRICVHEGLIHVASQKQGVWSPNILDDGINYIQSGQLLRRWCLQRQSDIQPISYIRTTQQRQHLLIECGSPELARSPSHARCSPWR